MSIRYTISFQNDHGNDGHYAFFVEPPKVAGSLTTPEVFTNAWISSFVRNGGKYDITTTNEMFAWCGKAPDRPSFGATVREGVSQPAPLGYEKDGETTPGSTFEMIVDRGVPDLIPIPSCAKVASFKIDTGSDLLNTNDRYLFGLGKIDNYGVVSPVASALAITNMSISLTPSIKFYVNQSNVETGEIVDFLSVSKKAGVIDFSSGPGVGKDAAVVIHKKDGTFDVMYHDSYKN